MRSAALRLPLVEAVDGGAAPRSAPCSSATGSSSPAPRRVSGTLRVLPLGGLGEIGKNMTVVEYDDRIVVVDCGLRFPTAEMMGIDLVLPDFTYLRERVDDIEAIVITHGHEDHLGALPWILRELGQKSVPVVYGGQLTSRWRARSSTSTACARSSSRCCRPARSPRPGRSRSSWCTSRTRSPTPPASR